MTFLHYFTEFCLSLATLYIAYKLYIKTEMLFIEKQHGLNALDYKKYIKENNLEDNKAKIKFFIIKSRSNHFSNKHYNYMQNIIIELIKYNLINNEGYKEIAPEVIKTAENNEDYSLIKYKFIKN